MRNRAKLEKDIDIDKQIDRQMDKYRQTEKEKKNTYVYVTFGQRKVQLKGATEQKPEKQFMGQRNGKNGVEINANYEKYCE